MLCLLRSRASFWQTKGICIYYELVAATLAAICAMCNFMALLYGGDLDGKFFCIKIDATNNVDDYLNIGRASRSLEKRDKYMLRDTLSIPILETRSYFVQSTVAFLYL